MHPWCGACASVGVFPSNSPSERGKMREAVWRAIVDSHITNIVATIAFFLSVLYLQSVMQSGGVAQSGKGTGYVPKDCSTMSRWYIGQDAITSICWDLPIHLLELLSSDTSRWRHRRILRLSTRRRTSSKIGNWGLPFPMVFV